MSQNTANRRAPKKSSETRSVFSEFGISPKENAEHSASAPTAAEPSAAQSTGGSERPKSTGSAAKTTAARSKSSGTAASQKNNAPKGDRNTVHVTTAPQSSASKKRAGTAEKTEKSNSDGMFRSSKPAHRVMPYFLILFAVFVGITLLLNLFCNAGNRLSETPEDHWMGLVGYYVSYVLLGLFGPAVLLLPFLILNLGIFWKKYIDSRVTISKITVSLLLLVFLSALIHTFYLISANTDYSASELMNYGATMQGGGIIGGKFAHWLVKYLNIIGSVILSLICIGLSGFYCIGMTPQKLWNRFYINRAVKRAEKMEQRAESEPVTSKKHSADKPVVPRKPTDDHTDGEDADPESNLAPMPMPTLDPSHGTRPFVPADIRRTLAAEARNARMANASSPAATVRNTEPVGATVSHKKEEAPVSVSKPATPQVSHAETGVSHAVHPPVSSQNTDTAIDPIFPRSNEAKQVRKIPRQERNFDLKNVFVDLDDETAPQQKPHATLPPEVPLPGAPQNSDATTAARDAREPSASERKAAPIAKDPASVKGTARPAAPATAKKAVPHAAVNASPADTSDLKNFGLTSEEFEKLEAKQGVSKLPPKKDASASVPAPNPSSNTTAKGASPSSVTPNSPSAPPTNAADPSRSYVFPPISYLHPADEETEENKAEVDMTIQLLADTLSSFNVSIKDITYAYGPTVTRYELFPSTGVRVRSIVNLADDIALALAAGGIRIEAPIPGKSAVGIEVPNKLRRTVYLRQLIEDSNFEKATSKLTASLGADIAGKPLFFDISKMPHLLVAGTTNSGKSVCINCIIMSLLYKARADEVKLLLIDPKKVEFSVYKNIPHLLAPIITTPKDAAGALQASVEEMERRFNLFEQVGARDIKGYNETTKNDPDMPFLPYIVIIIDELADLMMTASDEVETAICRIAQKARAAGMHLIVGTQRPSVDVVTGLIKSNIPSRIAFTVASQVDSKTILDYAGAEKLIGRGDMLFAPIGALKPIRVQGAFVDEKEVERICEFLRATNGTAQFDEGFISKLKELAAQCGNKSKGGDAAAIPDSGDGKDDALYSDAVRVAVEENRISTSLLQRKLSIGYGRAAKLIDRMQAEGIVSAPDGSKPRSVLITADDYITRFVDNTSKDESEEEE